MGAPRDGAGGEARGGWSGRKGGDKTPSGGDRLLAKQKIRKKQASFKYHAKNDFYIKKRIL